MMPSSESALRECCFILSHAVVSALLRELTVLRRGVAIVVIVTSFSLDIWTFRDTFRCTAIRRL